MGTGGSPTSVRCNIHKDSYCKDGSLFTQHNRFAPVILAENANHAQNSILPWKQPTTHMWHYGDRNALPCTFMIPMEYRGNILLAFTGRKCQLIMPETVSRYSMHSKSPPATITTNHALGRGSAVGQKKKIDCPTCCMSE